MIELDGITKAFSHQTALNQVSFSVNPGELVFLTGRSGAGKSTLLNVLAGLERPSQGTLEVAGFRVHQLSHDAMPFFRRRLGIISQTPKLLADYSIFENVAMPLVISGVEPDVIDRRVMAALEKVDLSQHAKKMPGQLSGGEQQRVSIARAVVHKPSVLLADEPTGNLDPDLSLEIMTLFARFRSVGVTVILATHDTHLLSSFDGRVLTLDGGTLINDYQLTQSTDEEAHHVSATA